MFRRTPPIAIAAPLRRRRLAIVLFWLLLAALCAAPSAAAADRIYWAEYDGAAISWANLDGSGGGDLHTAGAPMDGPMGLAIDSAAGRLYWVNYGTNGSGTGTTISWANLNGSGGGKLTTDATIQGPHGIAIDPSTERIYWTNDGTTPNTISYANLDGSGGGVLPTGAATVNGPRGLALDLRTHRIYWANHDGYTISYANLDGSGGGNLNTTGATLPYDAEGVAIDPVAERIYWGTLCANGKPFPDKISYANLDGSGGGDLNTMGATLDCPHGVAVDPVARRVYWANYYDPEKNLGRISWANPNGSGGRDLRTAGATVHGAAMPVLLKQPAPVGAAGLQGNPSPRAKLSCTPGRWAGDLLGSLLYRAPQRFSFRWRRGRHLIRRARSSALKPRRIGDYRCVARASNAAGSSSQASNPLAVFKVGRARLRPGGTAARLKVAVPDPGRLVLRSGDVGQRHPGRAGRAAVARKVRRGEVWLPVKLTARIRRRLRHRGRVKLKASVIYVPRGEQAEHQSRTLVLNGRRGS
jgi:hypothetical protein